MKGKQVPLRCSLETLSFHSSSLYERGRVMRSDGGGGGRRGRHCRGSFICKNKRRLFAYQHYCNIV